MCSRGQNFKIIYVIGSRTRLGAPSSRMWRSSKRNPRTKANTSRVDTRPLKNYCLWILRKFVNVNNFECPWTFSKEQIYVHIIILVGYLHRHIVNLHNIMMSIDSSLHLYRLDNMKSIWRLLSVSSIYHSLKPGGK